MAEREDGLEWLKIAVAEAEATEEGRDVGVSTPSVQSV